MSTPQQRAPAETVRRRLSDSTVRVLEPRRPGIGARLAELWRFRRLTWYFSRRYLRKGYGRTWLGWIWLPLKPILSVGSRVLIYGGLLKAPSEGVPYFIFFIVATSTWHLFDSTAILATRSIELNRRVLNRAYVPRLTTVAAAPTSGLVQLGLYGLMVAGVSIYYWANGESTHIVFGVALLLVPVGLMLMTLMGIAVGLWLAPFSPQARDVRWGLAYVLSFWYFLTPVIYPLSAVPEKYRKLAELNPLTGPVEMVRRGLFDVGGLTWLSVASCLVATFVLLLGGLWFFGRAESAAVDAI
jgi:lipopolysaccharide transport system permease protein